jgi:hypothetical protein
MNKSALQDVQQALNAMRSEIERTDDETKWAALGLMLGTSASVVAIAKKMAKPETKTVTRTISIPQTKVVKQPVQQSTQQPSQSKNTPNDDIDAAALASGRPQPPLLNQRNQ